MSNSKAVARPHMATVIANGSSGGGRAGKVLPQVARRLRDGLPASELHIVRSSSFEDARNLTRAVAQAARPGDSVIVMGGDGMAHLGLNACARTDATLGIIPAGTGNDFARAIGVPRSVPEAVQTVIDGRVRTLDLNSLEGPRGQTFVGAVVSSGYDARVNRATNDTRLRFGALSYGVIALKELSHFEPLNYRLTIDGEQREFEAMLVGVCNTGVFGGGMRISPAADPADGLLDLTIVHKASRSKLLRLLPSIYTGGFLKDPCVEVLRAKTVRVDGDDLFLMGDGEELGSVPATVTCVPGALKVYTSSLDG